MTIFILGPIFTSCIRMKTKDQLDQYCTVSESATLVYPFRMFVPDPNVFHPGSQIQIFTIQDPGSASNNLKYFKTQKIGF
jgi:hypothetical protein